MTTIDLSTYTSRDADLFEAVSSALRPRVRVRPSLWAEQNIRLDAGQGAQMTGPYKCNFYPWLRTFHDLEFDNPGKRGVACIKPAQIGATLAVRNIVLCYMASEDGSVLYTISRADDAKDMLSSRFRPMIKQIEALRTRASSAPESSRETMQSLQFDGGRVDGIGAGSPGACSSRTYSRVVIDEFDQSMHAFPSSKFGDLQRFALARMRAVRGGGWIWMFSHPTFENTGIDAIFMHESDQGAWAFDCPHCGGVVAPTSEMIQYRKTSSNGEQDPETAVLACPNCSKEICDQDRREAVWSPEDHPRGSGRRHVSMSKSEAARRDYVGMAINGLCNPMFSVREMAKMLTTSKSRETMQTTLNTSFGESMRRTKTVINDAAIEACVKTMDRVVVPGGPSGVEFVTVGVDVQAPRDNPVLYVSVQAWARSGHAYITGLYRLHGFSALTNFLRSCTVHLDEPNRRGKTSLGVRVCGIDDGFETRQVLDYCRHERVYSSASNGRVKLLPMQYQGKCTRDIIAEMAPEKKRINPTKPHLGSIDRYYLHRHSWVDRVLGRYSDDPEMVRTYILCEPPPDFRAHMMSNVLRPLPSQHGLEQEREEWFKPDEFRDDWLQAQAYAEVAAAMECGLDRMYMDADTRESDQSQQKQARQGVSFRGFERSGSYW